MPIVTVCDGYIFGAEGGVLSHQIQQNISFLEIAHYSGLSYIIDCKLYKTVYETETFGGQLVGLIEPSPTISDNPKLVGFSLGLSKDSFPNVTWNYRSFPLAGTCGGFSLPNLTPSPSLAECSFSIDPTAGPFDGAESVSFSENLDIVTKEVGSGGDGDSIDSPLAKFGFVIGKQIQRKMSLTLSKKPSTGLGAVSVTATSADGGTSCHISGARIDGIGETYAQDNFARFSVNLSEEEPYSGI